MTQNTQPWIEVWPLENIEGHSLSDTSNKLQFNSDLTSKIEESWAPKAAKGWKSSWVPFLSKMDFLKADYPFPEMLVFDFGTMAYKEIEGINAAIESGSPNLGQEVKYNPSLSVGFITATKDDKVILQRRPENVHCPNILIHEPCGYMTSLAFAPRSECDRPEHANDPRLFDLNYQLDYRARELASTFGVDPEAVTYQRKQDLLGTGWKTIEMYLSTTGRIDANESDLRVPKGQEILFVPFEHLKPLILNQGKLSRVDATGYRPSDSREMPLIDETLSGLIWGYEKLTGERLDIPETVDRIRHDGLDLKVHDTSPGRSYHFPTSF